MLESCLSIDGDETRVYALADIRIYVRLAGVKGCIGNDQFLQESAEFAGCWIGLGWEDDLIIRCDGVDPERAHLSTVSI